MDVLKLEEIEAVGSKLTKVALLKGLKEDTLRILKLVLDPMVTFGVTVDEKVADGLWLTAPRSPLNEEDFSDELHGLLETFKKRALTGNAALAAIDELVLKAPSVVHVKWMSRCLNKNLRAGFSSSSLNKAHPGSIKEFEVALATPYDPDKHEFIGDYFVEPKLDGLRMVIIGGKAFTRNGRQINTVQHIVDELASKIDLEDWVIDGEVMGAGEFDESSGDIRRKSTGTNEELYYNVFDIVLLDSEWNYCEGLQPTPFHVRRRRLEEMVTPSQNVRVVPSRKVSFSSNPTGLMLMAFCDEMIAQGYEGAMLKSADFPYTFDRSKAMFKLKRFVSEDLTVVGTFEGKGRLEGKLGGIIVDRNGVTSKVGSGFSDPERLVDPETLIGRVAEVQYQNLTPDGRLRFPSFLKFRFDKE